MPRAIPITKGEFYHGHDLSLTNCGIVVFDSEGNVAHTENIKSKVKGMRRLLEIETRIKNILTEYPPKLICVEDYSKGSRNGQVFNIGELGGVIRLLYYRNGFNYLDVAPKTLKKFIADNGNADKNEIMLAVYKRWGFTAPNDDIADGYGLAKISFALIKKEYGKFTAKQKEVVRLLYETMKAIRR